MTNDKNFGDIQAKIYNKMFQSYKPYHLMYEFIREPLTKNIHVLEVGIGKGFIARKIADRVKSIEATDFSKKMIENAEKIKHPSNIKFSCADIFDLPIDDNIFDTVISANILDIIPKPEKAMKEISRVLKPEGLLIAPTFLWKELTLKGKFLKFFMMKKTFH